MATKDQDAPGALSGLRIIDLTQVVMGPYATQTLADQGADVIIVEPAKGDTNRVMGAGPHPELSGLSLNLLRNKRSVSVDLKTEAGRDVVIRLIRTADAVVATMRPGALRRLGLSYEDVVKIKPDIVYAQAQGHALDGPRADHRAYDDIIQSASGLADVMAQVHETPELMPTIIADKVCGLVLAQALTAALWHRERHGTGQYFELPMVEVMKAFTLVEHGAAAISEPPVGPPGYQRILTPERRPQMALDGWVHVQPYQPEDYTALFAEAGRHDLLDDESLMSQRGTIANSAVLYRHVREIVATRTVAQWIEFCSAAGIPVTEVATLREIIDDLPLAEHPVSGAYRQIRPGVRFAGTPVTIRRHAPLIGQDNDEVLAELAEIEAAQAAGTTEVQQLTATVQEHA